MIQLEDKEFKGRFVLINSIRITVLCVFLFVSVFFLLFQVLFPIFPVIVFLTVSIIISFFHFPISSRQSIRYSIYFQILTDIVIITGLVYFSGGVSSPFYFLYFILLFFPQTLSLLYSHMNGLMRVALVAYVEVLCFV